MKIIVFFTLAMTISSLSQTAPSNVGTTCMESSDEKFAVSSFQISPWPVNRGDVSMIMTGISEIYSEISSLRIEVIFRGVPFYVENPAYSGNLTPGVPFTANFSTNIPKIAPTGDYTI